MLDTIDWQIVPFHKKKIEWFNVDFGLFAMNEFFGLERNLPFNWSKQEIFDLVNKYVSRYIEAIQKVLISRHKTIL